MILLKILGLMAIVIICFIFVSLSVAIGVQVGLEMFYKHREFKG